MPTRLILFLLVGGFATLFFDVRFEHGGILSQNKFAYIPLVASAIGVSACLLGMIDHPVLRKTLSILMAVTSITGILGLYYHTGFDQKALTTVLESNHRAEHTKGLILVMEGEPMPDPPPAVAPMAFTGLALIAAVVLYPQKRRSSS